MKEVESIKVGDKISIRDADKYIQDFLKDTMFSSLNVDRLRIMCNIKPGKLYSVVDVCKPCKTVKIKVLPNKKKCCVPVRFYFIDRISYNSPGKIK